MDESLRIQNMSAVGIEELLAAGASSLTASQAAAVREFIEQIGGVENAWAAVEMLVELEQAG